ncbi:MAG TPA: hypothetical protein VL595_05465 [Pseudonocardia sp.]|nr:hypothetical protein [Pseudonocardia sp.]
MGDRLRRGLGRGSPGVVAGLTTLLTLLAVACSGAQQAPPLAGPEQVVAVTFAGGSVQGGVSRTPVQLGRKVRLVVNSDVADEVHVHGYDLKAEVPAGGVGTVEFVADQPGVFEVELESRGAQVAQLEVR